MFETLLVSLITLYPSIPAGLSQTGIDMKGEEVHGLTSPRSLSLQAVEQ